MGKKLEFVALHPGISGAPIPRYFRYGPARQGETFRKCVDCGQEYKPKARNQKYCPECGETRKKRHGRY